MSQYRLDINKHEEKKLLFGFIVYWQYRIWQKGRLHFSYSLFFRKKFWSAKYFVFKPSKVQIGRKKFEQDYKGNKWLVPVNYELNLNLP